MVEYTKRWLSLDDQIRTLMRRGLRIDDSDHAASLLQSIGYYRLTGYLYPFLESEEYLDAGGRHVTRILNRYRAGTALHHAESIIDFDRQLRLLVLAGVERIEVAVRMRTGYILGRSSAFAYELPACFEDSFTRAETDVRHPHSGTHVEWLQRVNGRIQGSDERFVAHFRDKYDDHMPIWPLTELLELGHLSTLYRGMLQSDAEELARAFGVPRKKLMGSWLASVNYVRNVAAHHARLYNRKLQNAPSRPTVGQIPLLDHLRAPDSPKPDFGTYNALAVIAYLLRAIHSDSAWGPRAAALFADFPTSPTLSARSMGLPANWRELALWQA